MFSLAAGRVTSEDAQSKVRRQLHPASARIVANSSPAAGSSRFVHDDFLVLAAAAPDICPLGGGVCCVDALWNGCHLAAVDYDGYGVPVHDVLECQPLDLRRDSTSRVFCVLVRTVATGCRAVQQRHGCRSQPIYIQFLQSTDSLQHCRGGMPQVQVVPTQPTAGIKRLRFRPSRHPHTPRSQELLSASWVTPPHPRCEWGWCPHAAPRTGGSKGPIYRAVVQI